MSMFQSAFVSEKSHSSTGFYLKPPPEVQEPLTKRALEALQHTHRRRIAGPFVIEKGKKGRWVSWKQGVKKLRHGLHAESPSAIFPQLKQKQVRNKGATHHLKETKISCNGLG